MFDHDGLDRDELDYDGFDELDPDDFREQNGDGVASAVHGAVALLHSLHTERAAAPAALASWTAVYGTALVEPDLGELEDRFRARRPQTILDAFMAGAAAMGDAISAPTSVLLSQQLAAHVRLETELVKRLAQVTGRPVHAVLAYLDEWAAAETEEEL
jgi:hypothetical protein